MKRDAADPDDPDNSETVVMYPDRPQARLLSGGGGGGHRLRPSANNCLT